ncbi:MAG: UDP-N-acetylmuramoyl-tripeptide--D-alanyl-D-alanine ligase [Vicinamibacterales bacterium]
MTGVIVLDIGTVGEVTRGRVTRGEARTAIGGFSIDSRTTQPGDLFFAIKGERLDGHAFVADAVAAGAIGVVVSDPVPDGAFGDAAVVVVADTTTALQAVGRHVRRLSGATVVAITGSAGKTTTKELAADVLSTKFRTFRSQGNFNNHIGLPLSLIELRARPEMAVLELGMNHAGEIRQLVGVCEPDVRVWTNVGEAHLGHFGSLDAVADAKAEILEGATAATKLVVNADDRRVMARVAGFAGSVTTFGCERPATFRATAVRSFGVRGSKATVETPEGPVTVTTPLIGRGNVANVLAALAIAYVCGVPTAAAAKRVSLVPAAKHRGEVIRLRGDMVVVDDSYNSNPQALAQAFEALADETRAARRVAVVGEMLELGEGSVALHERLGEAASRAGLDLLVTVGDAPAEALGVAAVRAGLNATSVAHAGNAESAAELVVERVRDGDVVLVKGSRGVRLERVVERLQQRFV